MYVLYRIHQLSTAHSGLRISTFLCATNLQQQAAFLVNDAMSLDTVTLHVVIALLHKHINKCIHMYILPSAQRDETMEPQRSGSRSSVTK